MARFTRIPTSSENNNGKTDIELNHLSGAHLTNDVLSDLSWSDLCVRVKNRKTKQPCNILSNARGSVRAGELLAIMGPSGSGKTTLLNALAHRVAAAGAKTTGIISANGQRLDAGRMSQLSSYVEQEDALIGSLTCRETIMFAASLALPSSVTKNERCRRVDDLIRKFGLVDQADTIVGTPIQKGISGGQKKRLSVASRLVTDPKILFLDEPTSGLDSTLSFEVMKYIRRIAKENNLIVIASIHQPSTSTFNLFDRLCLLWKGNMCYYGPVANTPNYFKSIRYPVPNNTNPAEYYLDLVNTDLANEGDETSRRAIYIATTWSKTSRSLQLHQDIVDASQNVNRVDLSKIKITSASAWHVPLVLIHRLWIKSYRDVVVYGIRVAMYLGLAFLMGTVFLRFGNGQEYIQPYINALFFGGAFMSFMAVAYVPAFLEDRATFAHERANGLVGPFAFILSNFLIGIPFLFTIALLFSVVTYFMIGFDLTAVKFCKYVAWLFLDLLAAESLVVLVSSIMPIFVVSLAVVAFANGLWMCVGGFLVPLGILNVFWKYVFHFIDYQAYVFQGMMVNQFEDKTYTCAQTSKGYACQFPSSLNAKGQIDGSSVLSAFGIDTGLEGEWFGIMIAIILVYRILGYVALRLRRN